ncbi:hypothetical protein BRC82_00600 [Halobacteriales archaeon QS_1_67_19]|nr:MAG: hypothetical protein BRC82_00600 [Halobacteriales archaeon QS_1_67_19]
MVTLVRRAGSGVVLGAASAVALALGGLLVLYQIAGIAVPDWAYHGLFGLGTIGIPVINGYRDGRFVTSVVAAAIGALPLAVAFAPSGPPEIHLTLGEILLKATGGASAVGVAVGGLVHGVGLAINRFGTA